MKSRIHGLYDRMGREGWTPKSNEEITISNENDISHKYIRYAHSTRCAGTFIPVSIPFVLFRSYYNAHLVLLYFSLEMDTKCPILLHSRHQIPTVCYCNSYTCVSNMIEILRDKTFLAYVCALSRWSVDAGRRRCRQYSLCTDAVYAVLPMLFSFS